jgi:hypothetical protein
LGLGAVSLITNARIKKEIKQLEKNLETVKNKTIEGETKEQKDKNAQKKAEEIADAEALWLRLKIRQGAPLILPL